MLKRVPLHPGLGTLRDCRRGLATPPGRVSGPRAENPYSSPRSQAQRTDSEAASAAHLLRRGAAAAMLPMRDFRRRRRRSFAPLGQPLLFWLAALLVQAAAQPHAREHHAQHIMNQARAHQKACGCSVSSQSRRARSAERHAVEQYITSHRWRAGLDNVAEWRRVAGAGPTHERNNAGAPNNNASGSAASTRRARRLRKRTT